MEPDEFITREAFSALTEDERAAYMAGFVVELGPLLHDEERDDSRALDFISHYFNLLEWTSTPEEYERDVRSKLWDTTWANAEVMLAALEGYEDPSLTDAERADLAARIESVRAIIEHKGNLTALDETTDE